MPRSKFGAIEGLGYVDELVRLTAPPAGKEEICREGLALVAGALGAKGGWFLMPDGPGAQAAAVATWGKAPARDEVASWKEIVHSNEGIREVKAARGVPARVIVLLPGDTGATGALVLDRPSRWGAPA